MSWAVTLRHASCERTRVEHRVTCVLTVRSPALLCLAKLLGNKNKRARKKDFGPSLCLLVSLTLGPVRTQKKNLNCLSRKMS